MGKQIRERWRDVTRVLQGLTVPSASLQDDGFSSLQKQGRRGRQEGEHPRATALLRQDILHLLIHRLALVGAVRLGACCPGCVPHHLYVHRLSIVFIVPPWQRQVQGQLWCARRHRVRPGPLHTQRPWGLMPAPMAHHTRRPRPPDLLVGAAELRVRTSLWLSRRDFLHGAVIIAVGSGSCQS